MSEFHDVGEFHRKFGLRHAEDGPVLKPDPELIEFRRKFMQEELDEFVEGVKENNHAKMFDALIDLVYVALGTAHLCGYPWQAGWELVQTANMQKERALADGSNSKRGSSFDVVKPEGWEPPDIEGLLVRHQFHRGEKAGTCPHCERNFAEDHVKCYIIGTQVWCQMKPGMVSLPGY